MNGTPLHPPATPRLARLDWLLIAAISGAAIVVRMVYLHQAKTSPLFDKLIMDGRSYWEWSDRLVKGDWVGGEVFYQAPLYPYFLGVLKLAMGTGADGLWWVKVVQVVLGSLACGVMYLATRVWFGGDGVVRLQSRVRSSQNARIASEHRRDACATNGNRAAAAASAVLLAVYPPAIFFDSIIQKANLGLVLTVVLVWVLGWACARPLAWRAGAVGVVLGLMMLTREESIVLLPAIGLILFVRGRVMGKTGEVSGQSWVIAPAAFLIGAAVALAPAAIRNHHVGGQFVLTTSQAGPNFYIGNNPNATGIYAPLRAGRSNTPFERRDAFELAEKAEGRKLSPADVSRHWTGRAFEFIKAEPGKWLALIGRKALLLVNSYEIPDAENQEFFERFSPVLRGLARVWHFGVLVPLAGAGLVLTWARRRELWPMYVVIGATAGAIVLFYVFGRYRYPLAPMLMPFAGAAVIEAWGLVRTRRFRPLAMSAAAAIPLAIVSNYPMFDRRVELASTTSNAGSAVAIAGDDAGAVRLFNEALALNPNLADTLANLAAAESRMGRSRDALATLTRAVAMRPDDPRMQFRIGTLKAEMGDLPGATKHLQRAVQLAPQDIDSATNLSAVLLQQQRWADAAVHLRTATRNLPDDAGLQANLALLLATCPDTALRSGSEAEVAAKRAIARAPAPSADLYDILGVAHAQAGHFAKAVEAGTRALQIAEANPAATPPELLAEIKAHLELFRQNKAVPGK